MENAPAVRGSQREWPEDRLINPGHALEHAWIMLDAMERIVDLSERQLALDVIEGTLDLGWDREYGGLYYFMDALKKSPLALESTMKL